ncbi:MAG: MBL fold metallo-hydrolase [Lentisphaerae bacterium]|nr:MBL fold metallo-hydrolase [Lentisphaerota bacterium]MCP4103402.1 MBL fold metallo-hydrolase [Lentisphaerota bacterium]
MTLGITALGSGSRGNSFVVHSPEGNILIDAGFSRKELIKRMEHTGIDPASIAALLLTHEHEDHSKGCRVFCDQMKIPACMTFGTREYLQKKQDEKKIAKLPSSIEVFNPGTPFEIVGLKITPFAVQHDAVDPVGFVIEHGSCRIGFASDLGAVNSLAKLRLTDCDMLVLESNYDQDMLRSSDRQYYLKKRIMGRHGHLNNVDAMEALPTLLSEKTKLLYLVHISSECNCYELVRKLGTETLENIKRNDILFKVVEQDTPIQTVWLKELHGDCKQLDLFA